MIVKNETPVIRRCLASVKPWIDHWIIVDTGSTDGTQAMIREFMADVPGTLHERPWRDFAHNRNEALELARAHGDYLLFIDADETLGVDAGFRWPELGADGYRFLCELNGWVYERNALIKAAQPWRWEGVIHEFLTQDKPHAWQLLRGPTIQVSRDGARARDPNTYLRDIEVLERAVRDEPANTRYRFYLAQSYRDANKPADAMRIYQERVAMGGWEEEVWFSLFQIGLMHERIGAPMESVRDALLAAYQARPRRAEPLCELARYHRLRNEFALAHLYAQQAAAISRPDDVLFVDDSVYSWRALDELTVATYYVGAIPQGKVALERLLRERKFPEAHRARIEGNKPYFGL
jgi:hypothetical protein